MRKQALIVCILPCLIAVCFGGNPYIPPAMHSAHTITVEASAPQESSAPKEAHPSEQNVPRDERAEAIERALEQLERYGVGPPVDEAFLSWACETVTPDFAATLAVRLLAEEWETEPFYDLFGETLHVLWDRYTGTLGDDDRIHSADTAAMVTLAFTGDVNLADDWENMLAFRAQPDGVPGVISEPLLERMRDADILLVNNEFCFSDRGSPTPGKRYTFRAATENVQLLHEIGADIVSLANNHVFDYGAEAFYDTLDTLHAADIPYAGAGRDLAEAMQVRYFHAGGMKIAYVAAGRTETYMQTPPAAADSPGILPCYDGEELLEAVTEARQNADWVIAYLHWGTEYANLPEGQQVALAHTLVDIGADFVVGAHPHVLQSVEFYEGKPIVYSLGNFWFNIGWVDTALLEVELPSPGQYRLRLQPCHTAQGTVRLFENEAERRTLFHFMESISNAVRIDDDGIVHSTR